MNPLHLHWAERMVGKKWGTNAPIFRQETQTEICEECLNENVQTTPKKFRPYSYKDREGVVNEVHEPPTPHWVDFTPLEGLQGGSDRQQHLERAKEILSSIESEHIPIFSESEMSRMSDLHFILSVMSTLELGGYFTRDAEIEKMVATFNDNFPNRDLALNKIVSVLKGIKSMNLEPDSIWYRKSNFFTLVIELCKIDNINYDAIKPRLLDLEKNVLANKYTPREENEFATYYGYMYTGTNSRQARVVRSEIFNRHVLQ